MLEIVLHVLVLEEELLITELRRRGRTGEFDAAYLLWRGFGDLRGQYFKDRCALIKCPDVSQALSKVVAWTIYTHASWCAQHKHKGEVGAIRQIRQTNHAGTIRGLPELGLDELQARIIRGVDVITEVFLEEVTLRALLTVNAWHSNKVRAWAPIPEDLHSDTWRETIRARRLG